MTSPFDLTGKRAFVTGANTGIGQGIAVSLARAGASVACVGRSSMAETEAAIASAGGTSCEHLVDLADRDAAVAAFEAAAKKHGPFDILVNNAGIIRRADATNFSEADWDDVIDVNLKTAFFLAQAFGRSAIADGRHGSIVNIASMLSFQGGIRVASYTASKHGIAGITRLLACEWAGRNVNVNAIAPGYIVTNNTAALRDDEDRSAAILARIPAGRWGEASDIGGAAVFLASEAARYVHGAVLPVDGGWLAR
ncbi:2-dehydro-3-deoxy-D-gluconate 5-dehydrogenase KduD [Jiella endophytica]|uniref:2-dehydro-3-deoxy-D-gluconate 5-dehydrogenase KduD n=1 Tax=Jiella endophytica TaxID=2558362 RepID=A0A4Y8RTF3_9HYPH|nr:2-dehydro-3-deoxy-D-gluconate 5-dehydrogenase KduD [Jiella endophytica]TFF27579.1 2-dehydro-3-deoxy-D-gluconate 5-dehydrogenase KduD [Jiella endophytica]